MNKIKSYSTLPFTLPLQKASSGFSVSTKEKCLSRDLGGGSVADLYLRPRDWQNGSQWNIQTDLLLLDVRDHAHGGVDHGHGVLAKEPELIDELFPKAILGLEDEPAGLGPCVGVQQGHGLVLHETGEAEGDRAAQPAAHCCRVRPCFLSIL